MRKAKNGEYGTVFNAQDNKLMLRTDAEEVIYIEYSSHGTAIEAHTGFKGRIAVVDKDGEGVMFRPTEKRFVICQYYEPFVLGGSVWQWRRFQVNAYITKLTSKFEGLLFYCPLTKEWRIHESTTGGLLGEGKTGEAAIADANRNIETTPNLREQMTSLGDTSKFQVVEKNEALKRIAKSLGQDPPDR